MFWAAATAVLCLEPRIARQQFLNAVRYDKVSIVVARFLPFAVPASASLAVVRILEILKP